MAQKACYKNYLQQKNMYFQLTGNNIVNIGRANPSNEGIMKRKYLLSDTTIPPFWINLPK